MLSSGPGDEETVVRLWNETLTRDPISPELFKERTLGDPNFSPDGCLIAYVDEGPAGIKGATAGFAVAVPPGASHRFAPPPGTGRIAGLGVLPGWRRTGVGNGLLEAAFMFLRKRGCKKVVYAAHEYYVAGLDRAYADGLAFLEKHGFEQTYEAVAMGRELYDLEWPKELRTLEAKRAGEGLTAGHFAPPMRAAVEAFFAGDFPDWAPFFREKLDRQDPHDDIVLALDKGRVVGYCQRLEGDHVGPFGVAAAYRNRGIGTVMLYRLLDRMRQMGYRFCWFGETGRAQPYYARAGFVVTRKYAVMAKSL